LGSRIGPSHKNLPTAAARAGRKLGFAFIGAPLRKSNTDPTPFAPDDVTTLLATIGMHDQVKRIGDYDIAVYFKLCAAHRDVMDCAIDTRALKRDRSGL
jgi:hypothetical protein